MYKAGPKHIIQTYIVKYYYEEANIKTVSTIFSENFEVYAFMKILNFFLSSVEYNAYTHTHTYIYIYIYIEWGDK